MGRPVISTVATVLIGEVLDFHDAALRRMRADTTDVRFARGLARGQEGLDVVAEVLHAGGDLDQVGRALTVQIHRLREQADAQREDPRFASGVAWGLYALDRVARAGEGCTDPVVLGLAPRAPAPPPIPGRPR